MHYTFEQYQQSADYIRQKIGSFSPKVAMVLGSGLGYMGDIVEQAVAVPYGEIPHFKASTAPGHKGQLVFGTLEGVPVAVMQGRAVEDDFLLLPPPAQHRIVALGDGNALAVDVCWMIWCVMSMREKDVEWF